MWGQPSAVRPREAWQGSDAPEKAQKETKMASRIFAMRPFSFRVALSGRYCCCGGLLGGVRSAESTTGWRIRTVLHSRRRRAEAIAAAKTAAIVAAAAGLPVEVRRALLAESLQLGLVRSHDYARPRSIAGS